MFSFVIREVTGRVLIGLEVLIERIPCANVTHWRFRDITLTASEPFGIPLALFEEQSRISPEGVCVSNEEFNAFLRTDFQIIDGCIDGFSGTDGSNSLFCLDCVDASQWEATTEDENIANELEKQGWKRQ